ncbi:hypothetical protein DNTS_010233 [Danionella cerebrum]|uniref:HAUS augmin-like complex subunit 5 n=1 Tax=Danionella cerebrum TaxID=2873325 RepID=A0A553PEK6_9TELE|nr:hypothetical protein DNTS_010233 [Danionella translucida]
MWDVNNTVLQPKLNKMSTLCQELKRWAVEEHDLPASRLPDDGYIKALCVGPGASIWKYITQHAYKERVLKTHAEIEALQAELRQLDAKINRVEDQLAAEEQSLNRSWEDFTERRCRQILLDSFRQHCSEERKDLVEDMFVIGTQHQDFEELAKKAEVKLVFDKSDNSIGADPLVLKEVQELCKERVCFFQRLLESDLKLNPCTEFTQDQNKVVIQHWTCAVKNFLRSHPPNHVLSALQTFTSRQQLALKEKTANLNVENAFSSQGFRHDGDYPRDVGLEQEELIPVHCLLQSAWEEVQQNYFDLAQTRSRRQQLETEIAALMSKAEMRRETVAEGSRCVFELEMEAAKQRAVRDNIREQCAQLQLHARHGQDAIGALQTEWQTVMELRQLVNRRQDQIRSLIKGNSSVKMELTRVHAEVAQFLQETLSPQFGGVVEVSSRLRNSVSQGAKHFSGVSLAALDRRVINGGQRVPASHLSIHWNQSPAFHKLCQSLSFPKHMAPEQLCCWGSSQQLQLRTLRRFLRLLTESKADLEKLMAQLPAPDQQTLLQHIKLMDKEILQSLLPRAHELKLRFSKSLLYSDQLKTTITHWWEQPAQFALPEMQQEGQSFQQWLQRWKQATKDSYTA